MPLYDYHCPQGHIFEQLVPIAAREQQDCPVCGQLSPKIPSRVTLGGQASPGLAREQMPQTWRGTYEGHPEYVGQLRRQWLMPVLTRIDRMSSTHIAVLSDPVPAVVGTAISGLSGCCGARPAPIGALM